MRMESNTKQRDSITPRKLPRYGIVSYRTELGSPLVTTRRQHDGMGRQHRDYTTSDSRRLMSPIRGVVRSQSHAACGVSYCLAWRSMGLTSLPRSVQYALAFSLLEMA